MSQIPGVDLSPTKPWLFPSQVFLPCPAWQCSWLSATCSSSVASVSSPKSPLEAVGCVVLLVPSKQGRLSLGCVFQVGALSWEGPLTLSRDGGVSGAFASLLGWI